MSDEKQSKTPKIKLTYFPIRARGEVARMILAEGGLAYEDNRVEFADWGKLKSSTPFGQMPLLEYDGVELAQSAAIERFLARKTGLFGSNDFEGAQIDSVHEAVLDVGVKFVDVVMAGIGSGSDKEKAAWKALWEQTEKYSVLLEKVLKANNNGEGYFVGKSVTYADLHFYVLWEEFLNHNKKVFANAPLLEALFVRVSKRERIAKWLAARPPSRSPLRAKLKLNYFDGRGRAEVSRLLLAEGNLAYEDERLAGEAWGKVKDTTPFGQMPVLWVDTTPHRAVARHRAFHRSQGRAARQLRPGGRLYRRRRRGSPRCVCEPHEGALHQGRGRQEGRHGHVLQGRVAQVGWRAGEGSQGQQRR